MRTRVALVIALACVLAAAPASAQGPKDPLAQPIVTNLDGDPEPETLLARELGCLREGDDVPPPCRKGDVRRLMPTIRDTCNGQPVDLDLFPGEQNGVIVEFVLHARALDVDGDPARPEVFVQGIAGASGRTGHAALVRMTDVPGGCPQPRTLFAHPDPAFDGRPPRRTSTALGGVTIRDYRRSFPGQELRLRIPVYRSRDPGCCPSMRKTVWLRYDAGGDVYRRYRSRVTRVKSRS